MTEIEDLGNYSNNLDQLLLLRNKCAKLEVEVQKKESEKQNIYTLYTDLKTLFEKQRLEIQAQTLKLNTALEEKQKMQARYQIENQKLQKHIEEQTKNYQTKLKSMQILSDVTLKNKLEKQCEEKYELIIKDYQMQVDDLNQKYIEMRKEKIRIETEYEMEKESLSKEIGNLKKKNEEDFKTFTNKLAASQVKASDKSIEDKLQELTNLKDQLSNAKSEIVSLNKLIQNYKGQNNALLIEKKITADNTNNQLENEKLLNSQLRNRIEELTALLITQENEAKHSKESLTSLQIENKNLSTENEIYAKTNRGLLSERDEIKCEVNLLREKIEAREKEIANILNSNHAQNQERFMVDREKIALYQTQIEQLHFDFRQLTEEYKDNIDKEMKAKTEMETERNKLKEEKSIMQQQLTSVQNELEYIRGDYENKIRESDFYQHEYSKLENKFREANARAADCDEKINTLKENLKEKDKEISVLNEMIDRNKGNKKNYIELVKKKNYYKQKCRECNDNIKKILEKLTLSERDKIENEIKVREDNIDIVDSNKEKEIEINSSASIEENIGNQ